MASLRHADDAIALTDEGFCRNLYTPDKCARNKQNRFELAHRPPSPLNHLSLPLSGPWWHRGYDEAEGLASGVPELKVGPKGDGEAGTWDDIDSLLIIPLPPPDLPLPADEVPDLLHRPVPHSQRYTVYREGTVGEAPPSQPEKRPDLRTIWRQFELLGQDFCLKPNQISNLYE